MQIDLVEINTNPTSKLAAEIAVNQPGNVFGTANGRQPPPKHGLSAKGKY
jgi:hypothetical protein